MHEPPIEDLRETINNTEAVSASARATFENSMGTKTQMKEHFTNRTYELNTLHTQVQKMNQKFVMMAMQGQHPPQQQFTGRKKNSEQGGWLAIRGVILEVVEDVNSDHASRGTGGHGYHQQPPVGGI